MTTFKQLETMSATAFPGARILIVDDERATRHTLAELFRRMGYRAVEADSGQAALEHIAHQRFDLVILDLKMPGMDGTEVLKAARPLAPGTVFIILTAYGTLDSAIASIRHGAFDYLLKPSPVKEIIRAVEAGLTKRQQQQQRQEEPVALLERALANLKTAAQKPKSPPLTKRFLQVPDITVDALRRLVVVRGQPVDLTPTEFDILTYLMRHCDRVVSCRELVAHVRGYDLDERDARLLLRSHIHRLRRKLKRDVDRLGLIRTVRGSGYILSTKATKTQDLPAS
ncbi:MAG: response regulator transcription factor [Chloroflexota bacterium]|nr:response regulator transcription factor [Chloroflexota bacterium]